MALRAHLLGLLLLVLLVPARARAGAGWLPEGFVDEPVVGGLSQPVGMAFLPDGRLLVTEQTTGAVRVVRGQHVVPAPAVALDSLTIGFESGLLGIAVDPGWPARPYFYVQSTWAGGPSVRIARYRASGDLDGTGNGRIDVDYGTRLVVLEVPDRSPMHNGGTLRFGPDGMLYASLGDDADPCAAMYPDSLKGVLLRLDVSALPDVGGRIEDLALVTPAGNPFAAHPDPRARLVWAYGLRNVWNFHFDPPSGLLFLADVGDYLFEEIDVVDAPGLYFGYPAYEGLAAGIHSCAAWDTAGARAPIHTYDHTKENGSAVIGGGRYRIPPGATRAFPAEYDGDYFFGDLVAGHLRRLRWNGSAWVSPPPAPGQPNATDWATGMQWVTDYLTAPDGSLWYCRREPGPQPTGEIRRIWWSPTLAASRGAAGSELTLEAPRPQPANAGVRFGFRLPAADRVRLAVYDLAGRRVRTLAEGEDLAPGPHEAAWDGRDEAGRPVPAGLYLLRLAGRTGAGQRRCLIAR